MTEPRPEPHGAEMPAPDDASFPEAADDDYPERARYPEPEEPMLPADDGYVGTGSTGTTVEEMVEGESLDEKLGRERPEPVEDPLRPRGIDEPRDDVPDGPDATADDVAVGSLVAPDEGARGDAEKDEVATMVEERPSAAEETAIHVEPER